MSGVGCRLGSVNMVRMCALASTSFTCRAGGRVYKVDTDLITSHFDTAVSCNYVVGLLFIYFMDFSSAFNCIQPRVLLQRLLDLNVTHSLIFWLRDFLSDRPQRVTLD